MLVTTCTRISFFKKNNFFFSIAASKLHCILFFFNCSFEAALYFIFLIAASKLHCIYLYFDDFFQFVIIRSKKVSFCIFIALMLMQYKCSPPPPGQSAVLAFSEFNFFIICIPLH